MSNLKSKLDALTHKQLELENARKALIEARKLEIVNIINKMPGDILTLEDEVLTGILLTGLEQLKSNPEAKAQFIEAAIKNFPSYKRKQNTNKVKENLAAN